ncbi:hypothetical protein AB0B01_11105 [Streptomyces sp. NPDC044571]
MRRTLATLIALTAAALIPVLAVAPSATAAPQDPGWSIATPLDPGWS